MDFKIMKKIVFGLLMTMGMLNAQNNLVYNQTINLELNLGQEVVVPEGKTWKIEFIDVEEPNGINSFQIGILNSSGQYNIHVVYTVANTIADAHLIWLKEGSKIIGGGTPVFVSALEFNIVPTSTGTGSVTGGGGVSSDGLVFSGVINQFIPTSSVAGSFGTVAGSFTVPEGKIWKINNMTHNKISSSTGGFVSLNGALYVSMDGIPIYVIGQNKNVVSDTTTNTILTPGTYELKWYQGSGAGGPFYCGTITHLVAIEYNLP